MKLLNKLICLIKGHDWAVNQKLQLIVNEKSYHGFDFKCTRCGKLDRTYIDFMKYIEIHEYKRS